MSGRRPASLPMARLCAESAAAVGLTVLASTALQVFDGTVEGQAWEAALDASVAPLADGVWRVLRGGLAFLAIPTLTLAFLCAVVVAFRNRSRGRALGAVVVAVGANLIVQVVKHTAGSLQCDRVATLQNLSGHVGVGAAIAMGFLLVVPPARLTAAIWGSWLLVAGLCAAILLTKWHTLSEVLVPLLGTGAWAVAVFAIVGLGDVPRRSPCSRAGHPGRGRAIVMVGGGTSAIVLVWLTWPMWNGHAGLLGALGASFILTVGAAAVTVGATSAFVPPTTAGETTDGRTAAGISTDGPGARRNIVVHE